MSKTRTAEDAARDNQRRHSERRRILQSHAALLAAAKAAIQWADDERDSRGMPPDIKDQLRAAIAAAEGGRE